MADRPDDLTNAVRDERGRVVSGQILGWDATTPEMQALRRRMEADDARRLTCGVIEARMAAGSRFATAWTGWVAIARTPARARERRSGPSSASRAGPDDDPHPRAWRWRRCASWARRWRP